MSQRASPKWKTRPNVP